MFSPSRYCEFARPERSRLAIDAKLIRRHRIAPRLKVPLCPIWGRKDLAMKARHRILDLVERPRILGLLFALHVLFVGAQVLPVALETPSLNHRNQTAGVSLRRLIPGEVPAHLIFAAVWVRPLQIQPSPGI